MNFAFGVGGTSEGELFFSLSPSLPWGCAVPHSYHSFCRLVPFRTRHQYLSLSENIFYRFIGTFLSLIDACLDHSGCGD